MSLTSAQKTALKNAINADPTLSAYPNTSDGNFDLCSQQLNVTASPAYIVWTDRLTPQQARSAIVQGASQLDGLTQGKRDELFYLVADTLDCRDANIRAGLDDACGSQNTLKAAIQAAEKRNALLGEKILCTSGSGTSGAPGIMGYTGNLIPSDVMDARNS